MTAVSAPWSGSEALPPGSCLLLEASAGTGKTWQIAHLVARLVAQEGLGIERMLLITFTKAATAELRDRVRRRLLQLQLALLDQLPASDIDPLLAELLAHPDRPVLLGRVTAALTGFDQAPISTIHGFCQRMLTQLAFESGQSPGLEVMTDAAAVLAELVDDELANLFASTNELGVDIAKSLGWSRAGLRALAAPMSAAVAPIVLPPSTFARGLLPGAAITQVVQQWLEIAAQTRQWLADPQQGGAAVAALEAELAIPSGTKGAGARRFKGTYGKILFSKGFPALIAALNAGMPLSEWKALEPWDLAKAQTNWIAGDFASFEGSAVFARLAQMAAALSELYPLARSEFAQRARATLDAELERRGVLSYEAMLWRLAERIELEGPQGPLARAVRERFDVALIDEFQDTDAAQWAVLSGAFAHAERRLLLIGDPKQAIYAFRGADVHVYLQAAEGHRSRLPQRATMTTNWRSDPALVQAMNHLWADSSRAFGAVPFDYIAVQARPNALAQAIVGGGPTGKPRCPLEIRWLDAGASGDGSVGPLTNKANANKLVYQALLREITALLQPDARLLANSGPAEGRPVRPQDLAILVRTNAQAETIQQMLISTGIAAVTCSDESVMLSQAAEWLLSWLDALARPGYERALRTAVVTPLFGWTLPQLAAALANHRPLAEATAQPQAGHGEESKDWGAWLEDVQSWANLWTLRGFVLAWEQAQTKHAVLQRLLASEAGERHATDLRHLVELCHAEERTHRSGPGGLAAWLRRQRGEGQGDELSRRLESDAQAVQIVTIHKSKGLEYPIVLAPFLWDTRTAKSDAGEPLLHHGDDGQLALDLRAANSPGRGQIRQRLQEEQLQEESRLLYVALTRAAHHAVAWLVPAGETAKHPERNAWARLLLRERDAQGQWLSDAMPPELASGDDVAAWQERLEQLCATSQGTLGWSIEEPLGGPLPAPVLPQEPNQNLQARAWTRGPLNDDWKVTSYSALARRHNWDEDDGIGPKGAPAESAQGLPSTAGQTDDATTKQDSDIDDLLDGDTSRDGQLASWQALGAGPDVGTWVHAVLEHLDFASAQAKDLRSLAQLSADLGWRHAVVKPGQHAALQALAAGWLHTPLDGKSGLPKDFSLARLPMSDRLDEFPFDLSLGLGAENIDPEAIQTALLAQLHDSTGEGSAWLARVQKTAEIFPSLHGILTGTIDLVLRAEGRFYIADYKTNRLKDRQGQVLVASQYLGGELARAMAEHGYHLQSLLYSLAVHRWLRQRLGETYSYDRHFGGHLYLFLRGMDGSRQRGPDLACPGVFAERWPLAVIQALDSALSPGQPAAGGVQ
jgi:exodeoxyribonuclease V beta subunit